jgi:DNA-binding NarL/FixJ family response regulator
VEKLRVFLADDHPVVRCGLKGLINSEPDMEVVGEAWDGAATIRDVLFLRPDVVVMDVSMPGVDGVVATERIRRDAPDVVRVLALTMHEDRGYLKSMLRAGASGYVLKRTAVGDLVRAIRAVAAGEIYLDPAIAGHLVHSLSPEQEEAQAIAELSTREEEVLRLIAQGHPIKQIAARLDVGVRTIETYRVRGMEKLSLKNRADIVRYALHQGWLNPT